MTDPPPPDPTPVLDEELPSPVDPLCAAYPAPPLHIPLVAPTLQEGAVAVITIDDALSLLTFDGARIARAEVARDYIGEVAGGELSPVVPALLEGACVYLQSRRLVVYSFTERAARTYLMTGELEEMPIAAAWVSLDPPIIAACQRDTSRYSTGKEIDYRLRTFALRERAAPLGVHELGSDDTSVSQWTAGRGVIAVFDDAALSLFTPDLAPISDHPLARAVGARLGPGRALRDLRLHPLRDEAILVIVEGDPEEAPVARVLRAEWRGDEIAMTPLAEGLPGDEPRLGVFSPCGAWISYQVTSPMTVAVYAHHLVGDGPPPPPVFLGLTVSARVICWTRDPLALVAFDDDLAEITRWDLTALAT